MILLAAQSGATAFLSPKEFVEVLSGTLLSLLTAAAVGGGAVAAPASLADTTGTHTRTVVNAMPVESDPDPFTYRGHYLLAGDTDTIAPLKPDLPAGTFMTLDEGAGLDELRADGWSISVTDSVLTVTAPRDAEGKYHIPVIVTYPDGSTETTAVTMDVDYLVDTSLIRLSARELGRLSSLAP